MVMVGRNDGFIGTANEQRMCKFGLGKALCKMQKRAPLLFKTRIIQRVYKCSLKVSSRSFLSNLCDFSAAFVARLVCVIVGALLVRRGLFIVAVEWHNASSCTASL